MLAGPNEPVTRAETPQSSEMSENELAKIGSAETRLLSLALLKDSSASEAENAPPS
jgi:hypothetical protein